MYRFVLRPRWLAGHIAVITALVVMVNLGLWQLRRLDERRAQNDLVRSRSHAAAVPVASLAGRDVNDVDFRRVEATGTFDAAHEVLVGYRTSNGLPGYHVVTPLRVGAGTAVLVNRGFVPLELANRWPLPDAAPPEGEVRVVGLARRGITASATIGEPAAGDTPKLDNVDIEEIDRYIPGELLPMQIELQQPTPAGFPDPLPPLDLGDGPHLSYALQWFAFSTIGAVGWLMVLRRAARRAPPRAPVVSSSGHVIS